MYFHKNSTGLRMWRPRWILSIIAIFMAGCSGQYEIYVLDLDSGSPLFQFKKDLMAPPAGKAAVVVRELVVAEVLEGNQTSRVWRVASNMQEGMDMKEVRYGVIPVGFSEKLKSQPLVPGKRYVVVTDGPGQFGSTVFVIPMPVGN